ncbi:hypothetical protein DBB29_24885 [Pandoraea cepalis]|uniref:Uncharacterized protein n=1 Tax=Pandoraea cepalis TaxID=2508294 RepID=A0AAW7MGY6_9BURK|nr:hypothetical protein [Pandoraea cepalis]MDN4571898.1 hypothetical protein [Pandoraea cepalis]MDN4581352.1 hypothetical protein [Pandoraea cepalis]
MSQKHFEIALTARAHWQRFQASQSFADWDAAHNAAYDAGLSEDSMSVAPEVLCDVPALRTSYQMAHLDRVWAAEVACCPYCNDVDSLICPDHD